MELDGQNIINIQSTGSPPDNEEHYHPCEMAKYSKPSLIVILKNQKTCCVPVLEFEAL